MYRTWCSQEAGTNRGFNHCLMQTVELHLKGYSLMIYAFWVQNGRVISSCDEVFVDFLQIVSGFISALVTEMFHVKQSLWLQAVTDRQLSCVWE